jgi:hypothetical protein
MKLFRHFRPGGISLGQAQAGSTIRSVHHAINERLVPGWNFANQDLPFLLAYHAPDLDSAQIRETPSQAPWPLYHPGVSSQLPNRSNAANWFDPNHAVFHALPPDQPVLANVVGFRATPYKRVFDGQRLQVLGGAELSRYLGLQTSEWPVLVVPDFVDVELSVVDQTTAAQLGTRDDWLENWRTGNSAAAQAIRRSVTTFRFRACLRSNPVPPLSS